MEDADKLLKIPKSECPDIWIRRPRQKMAQIMVQYGRPSRSSWKEFVRSSFGRTVMGKAIWENPIVTWLGENSKLGMSLCTSWKRIIFICVCGLHQIGWKETKYWSDVETTQQRSRFGRTTASGNEDIRSEREKLEKIPAWDLTKVRNELEVTDEARTKAQMFVLPHWWTSVIWRMQNWRPSTKNERVELFSEATLWKMFMTAAKIIDIISRLPGCAGQAADAVSAYTHVKNGGCFHII